MAHLTALKYMHPLNLAKIKKIVLTIKLRLILITRPKH